MLEATQERPFGQLPVTTEMKVLLAAEAQVDMLTTTAEEGVKVYQALGPVVQGDE